MFDLLFLLVVTWLIFSRLFMILGKYEGKKKAKKYEEDIHIPEAKILEIKPNFEVNLSPDIQNFCLEVRKYDINFTAEQFIEGAKRAFETITNAVNSDDQKTLSLLLDNKLLQSIGKNIKENTKKGNKEENIVVGIKNIDIIKTSITNKVASIAVSIESENIFLVKNMQGSIIKGDASLIEDTVQQWQFKKKLTLQNNIWMLDKIDI